MRALKMLLMGFSLVGCAIPRPNTDVCVVNAPGKKLTCYNMERDYDENGKLHPGAKPHFIPAATIQSINKSVCIPFGTDGHDYSNLKAYIQKLREEYQNKCVIQ